MPHSYFYFLRTSFLLFLVFLFVQAQGAFTTPEGISVVLLGDVQTQYQNNIFYAYSNRVADETLILSPGIEITWGNGDRQGLHLQFIEDFLLYNNNTNLNTNLANLNYNSFWHGDEFKVDVAVSFIQTQSNTSNVRVPNLTLLSNVIVLTNTFDLPFHVEWDFSEPVYLKAGAEATMTAYPGTFKEVYNKNFLYQFPINFYYRATDRFHIGPGYRFSYTDYNTIFRLNGLIGDGFSPASRYENFFNIGVRSQLIDALEINFMVGYAAIELNSPKPGALVHNAARQMDIFAFNGELIWVAGDPISFYGNCSRDFATGSNGQLQVVTTGTLGVQWNIDNQWSVQASATYSHTVYQNLIGSYGAFSEYFNGQVDNSIDTNLVLLFTPTELLTLSVGYSYQDNRSNQQGSTYMNNLFFGKIGLTF
jgi:hypothetical protein